MDAEPGRRVGRRRQQGSSAPPIWFGLPFAGGGLLLLFLGLSTPGAPVVFIVPFGALFVAVGVGLVWTSYRARANETSKPRINVGPLEVERFTRSPMQVLVDFVLGPIGGVAFLVVAVISLPTIIGPIVFGFFGILLLRGAAVTVRRGLRPTVATVGPGGIWTPELGRELPWSEIAELRVEDAYGIGGSNNNAVVGYRRLGIVPRSSELIETAPGRGAMGMARGFMSLINTIRPGTGLSDPMLLAPYAIQGYEIEQPFAEVVRSVQRFAPVANAEIALGDGTRVLETVGAAPPLPPSPTAVAAAPDLLEGLGVSLPSLGGTSLLTGRPLVPSAAAPVAAPESRTFLRDGGPIGGFAYLGEIGTVLPWIVMPGIFLVGFTAVSLFSSGPANGLFFVSLPFLLIPLGFAAYGISLLLVMPARWRIRSGDPGVLTIDADGVDLRGMGRLRWVEIEEVRVVDSGRPTGEGSPSIPRIEIVPRDPARLRTRSVWDRRSDAWRSFMRRLKPFGDRSPIEPFFAIDLDLLDANPNEVIDLIARYRVVDDQT
ncbi:MAG: hypothetical protein L0227_05920 [Chloroflexi bacterium]|nr:hypothetical protein [Chloroflexota bacterium]